MKQKSILQLEKESAQYIHLSRLREECVFQLMIKKPFLKEIKLENIIELARDTSVMVGNLQHAYLKSLQTRIDDDIANDQQWIVDLLEQEYTKSIERGEKKE